MSDVDKSLEQLLSKASPRPVPDPGDAAAAKAAVRAEWQAVTRKRRNRKRVASFALAASVLVAVFVTFSSFRGADVAPLQVASIQKSFGTIYLLAESSELTRADDLANVYRGQTIVTGHDAGIALAWQNGASVRLDHDTEVEFKDGQTIYLRSGRVYFDSAPSEFIAGISAGGIVEFKIETDVGSVTHSGTQFMTEVTAAALTVSVREGQVFIDGQYHDHLAASGEQVQIEGRQRPRSLSIPTYGEAWSWIGETSPAIDVEGSSIHAFLGHVCRELGLQLKFENDGLEAQAMEETLQGRIDQTPADALPLRMDTTGWHWRIDEGVIYVSSSE